MTGLDLFHMNIMTLKWKNKLFFQKNRKLKLEQIQ